MYIKTILMVVTFLVTINAFGAEAPESSEERKEQKFEVPTAPQQKIVLPRIVPKGMILFNEGVTAKPQPKPIKPQVMRCRDYDVRFIESVHPTEIHSPCS